MNKQFKIFMSLSVISLIVFIVQCLITNFKVIVIEENSITMPFSCSLAVFFAYFAASVYVHNKLLAKYAPTKPYDKDGLTKISNLGVIMSFGSMALCAVILNFWHIDKLLSLQTLVSAIILTILSGIMFVGIANVWLCMWKKMFS